MLVIVLIASILISFGEPSAVSYSFYNSPISFLDHQNGFLKELRVPVLNKVKMIRGPAHYDFGYDVKDPFTGDDKVHHESRRGDQVQGVYSLIDPDGTKRTVRYYADKYNGFQADIEKEYPILEQAPVLFDYDLYDY